MYRGSFAKDVINFLVISRAFFNPFRYILGMLKGNKKPGLITHGSRLAKRSFASLRGIIFWRFVFEYAPALVAIHYSIDKSSKLLIMMV